MEAFRKIVTVSDVLLKILVPENFRNRKVEVIIIPSESESDQISLSEPDLTKFYGRIKSGLDISEIDKKLKLIRSEWGRLPD
jgi:hypothetical protein